MNHTLALAMAEEAVVGRKILMFELSFFCSHETKFIWQKRMSF
jgi:hypothetical protein